MKKDNNIKETYTSESIESFDDLSGIRQHPAMYIGDITEESGYHHLIFEILDNAVDEKLAGYGDLIKIKIDGDIVVIRDYARGIPCDPFRDTGLSTLQIILERAHTGGKARSENSAYKISGGLHGLGLTAVTALSGLMCVNVYRDGIKHSISYKEGKLYKEFSKEKSEELTGTEIIFQNSKEIFTTEGLKFNKEYIINRIKNITYLNPGTEIELDFNGEQYKADNKKGLHQMLEDMVLERKDSLIPLTKIFNINGNFHDIDVQMSFCWTNNLDGSIIRGYTNCIPQKEGSHISGSINAINFYFQKYILDEMKKKVSNNSIKHGLILVVSVKMASPKFASQNKEKLVSDAAKKATYANVSEQIKIYYSQNAVYFNNVFKNIVRNNRMLDKINEIKKDNSESVVSDMFNLSNSRLMDAYSKDINMRELFIVEGRSAAGTVKGARNPEFQGVLALRGKPYNPTKGIKINKNAEIASILMTLNQKKSYKKIIILCDGDEDGKHIKTLVLGLIALRYPKLISEGKIYSANPPLYYVSPKSDSKSGKYISFNNEMYGLILKEYPELIDSMEFSEYRKEDLNKMIYVFLKRMKILSPSKKLKMEILGDVKYYVTPIGLISQERVSGQYMNSMYQIFFDKHGKLRETNMLKHYNLNYNLKESVDPVTAVKTLFDFICSKHYRITRFKGLGEMTVNQIKHVIEEHQRVLTLITTDNISREMEYVVSLLGSDGHLRKDMIKNISFSDLELSS